MEWVDPEKELPKDQHKNPKKVKQDSLVESPASSS